MLIGEHIFKLLGRLLVIVASFLILTIGASGFLIVLPVVATPTTLWFNFNIFWGKLIGSDRLIAFINADKHNQRCHVFFWQAYSSSSAFVSITYQLL